jgi:hypothetical protein
VQNQPEIAFDPYGDALTDAAQFANCPPLHDRNRRLDGPKQERARQSNPRQGLANDPGLQRSHISRDVG